MRFVKVDFLCTECGYEGKMSVPATNSKKNLSMVNDYCTRCNEKRDLYLFHNLDQYKASLNFKPVLTEEEQLIYDLVNKEKEHGKTR